MNPYVYCSLVFTQSPIHSYSADKVFTSLVYHSIYVGMYMYMQYILTMCLNHSSTTASSPVAANVTCFQTGTPITYHQQREREREIC